MYADVPLAPTVATPDRRVHSVQALRGIAAAMVVVAHAIEHGPGRAVEPILLTGRFGVDIFFVISGFVIVYVAGDGRFAPWKFLRRRLWRVVPLYWALTLIVAATSFAAPQIFKTTMFDPAYLVRSLLFIPTPLPGTGDWRPLFKLGWTLNYEIFFYLVVTALWWCPTRLQRMLWLTAILGVFCLASFAVDPHSLAGFYANLNLAPFLGGAWLAWAWQQGIFLRIGNGLRAVLVAVAVVLTLAFYQLDFAQTKNPSDHLLMAASAFAIAVAALTLESRAARFALSEWLGDISYSLYLSHMFVVGVGWAVLLRLGIVPLSAPGAAGVAAICLVSLVAAHLLYRYFERPLMTLVKLPSSKIVIAKMAALRSSDAASISVIVPTHGRPSLLERALDSVAAQELQPAEVLVVDDIGHIETQNLIRQRLPDFPAPLIYICNDREPGACGSRNRGARDSKSDLLAFLDDDDEWDSAFLSAGAKALEVAEVDFALTEIERTFPDGTVKHLTTPAGLKPETILRQRVHMTGSSFIIRREAFAAVEGFDRSVPVFNDWDLFIRLVRAGQRYTAIPRVLVRWIEHDGDRITTATLRRADGIDFFLRRYGPDMRFDVRAYYTRIAYGIRKANERSMLRRSLLTIRMFFSAGILGSGWLVGRAVREKVS